MQLDMVHQDKNIWITWEHQRRSVVLSKTLGVKYYELMCRRYIVIRPILLSVKTILLLLRERPTKVFVQNPSNILAVLACIMSKALGFKVIVDRHSNFIFTEDDARQYSQLSVRVSNWLSKYSIKNADLTIVTNDFIKCLIDNEGGRSFILPDKLPEFDQGQKDQLRGKYNIAFPCTFSPDEPVDEVLAAARLLPRDNFVYITGNHNKYLKKASINIPDNVVFTGYLSESEYQRLLNSVDLILSLTTRDHTLLCCAYESVSLRKPLVLSNKRDLADYFYKGRIITENESAAIFKAICKSKTMYPILSTEMYNLHQEIQCKWQVQFKELYAMIERL